MKRTATIAVGVVLFTALFDLLLYAQAYQDRKREIGKVIKSLRPLEKPIKPPENGDWLKLHKEKRQTFAEYCSSEPTILTAQRSKLYILPIGITEPKDSDNLKLIQDYLATFFSCECNLLDPVDLKGVPDSAKRTNHTSNKTQYLTTFLLESILKPRLPDDGVAVLGLTSEDLWPGNDWNFVFGQASYHDRVGVWSSHRLVPDTNESDVENLLKRRMLKVASHETGHMLSLPHCVIASCNMQGSNSLHESDAQPLALCPECTGKVLYATDGFALERAEKLHELLKKMNLAEYTHYQREIQLLK